MSNQKENQDFEQMYKDLEIAHQKYKADAMEAIAALTAKLKAYENSKDGKAVIEYNGRNYQLNLRGRAQFGMNGDQPAYITQKDVIGNPVLQANLINNGSGLLSLIEEV